jgi:hypothetical protein
MGAGGDRVANDPLERGVDMEKNSAPRQLHVQQRLEPDDPHQELKTQLAVFLISLIQAFLRTGYYTADHPESQKAKAGLYEAFQSLFTRRDELTFLVREGGEEGKSIHIEGVLPDPQPLKAMMLEGMAEMYTPRFVNYLERKDLVSLTLKNSMTEAEFISFVDMMSEPRFVDTQDEEAKERFREELQKRGIFNISYIFHEELLATKRKIPWRARLALTRLKKDISSIPFFLKLGAGELKKVRSDVVRDVARPIREPDVVYPILMNTDLAGSEEFSEADIDLEIVAALTPNLLLGASRLLLKAAVGEGEGKAPDVAKLLAHFMNIQEVKGREPVLEGFFRNEFIPLEALPWEIRNTARLVQLTDKFLEHGDTVLQRLNTIENPETYYKSARSIAALIPELLRRNAYEAILKIVARIADRTKDGSSAVDQAGKLLNELINSEIARTLKSRFLTAGREHTDSIAPIFAKLDQGFLPHLVAILKESNDGPVRRKTWEVISQLDPSAMDNTLAKLTHEETPTNVAVSILRLLGDIDCRPWKEQVADALHSCLMHDNALVRQEALWAFFNLMGADGEKEYLQMLDDPDLSVQKQAITCLGKMKSEPGLHKFFSLIHEAETSPSDRVTRIEDRLFEALGHYGNVEAPGEGSLEDFLLAVLDRRLNDGAFKFMKKKKNVLRDNAVIAICRSLGEVGTEKSCSALEKLARQEGSSWSGTAEEVLSGIRERYAG